jgi:DNA-directed RNA polymerase subunit RPC12/RpoP
VLILKKNKKKGIYALPGMKSGRCPYCGGSVFLRSADGIYKENSSGTMLYVCSRYPACDAYVRVIPGTKTPIGSLANGNLRALRREAHYHFDRLHLSGLMSRKEAYEWLSAILQTPLSQAHIGYLGEYYCRRVIDESKQVMENRRMVQAGWAGCPALSAVGGGLYAAK